MEMKDFRLYRLFVRCMEELAIKERISYTEFHKVCKPTIYKYLPEKIKEEYKDFCDEYFSDSSNNLDLNTLLQFYTDYILEFHSIPNDREVKEETSINPKKYFKDAKSLKEALINFNSTIADYLFNETDIDEDYKKNLEEEVRKHRRFIITTAVSSKKVDEGFLNSIKYYANKFNAMVIGLPCEDVASRKSIVKWDLDYRLKDFWVAFEDVYLNKNVCISTIETSAKMINPLTGLDRCVQRKDATLIVASPKQFLKYIPNVPNKLPMGLMTTGAITEGNYDTDYYMSKRTSALAESDHKVGAIIVEVENDNIFHFRQIQASETGSFYDLGIEYLPSGGERLADEVTMVVGDSHCGMHDEELLEAILNSVESIPAIKNLILHDVFNASSISHHDIGKIAIKASKANDGLSSLKKEGLVVKNYLERISKYADNIVIVKANHDEHLDRYLEEGRFVYDPENFYFSLDLCKKYIEGDDPLRYMLVDKLGMKVDNITWLRGDETFNRYGIEFGYHGSRGANGGKGNPRTFENGLGKCVIAHSHSAQIFRDVYYVGTSSQLDMKYNKGLSSWTRTCCLCYPDGSRQLINYIPVNGQYKWRLEK